MANETFKTKFSEKMQEVFALVKKEYPECEYISTSISNYGDTGRDNVHLWMSVPCKEHDELTDSDCYGIEDGKFLISWDNEIKERG